MTNAERVKALRKLSGLSAQKFGDKYGIPLRTIQEWERGGRNAPEYVIDMLEYIAMTERIALMAWCFETYRDKGGSGYTKLFASKAAAIEYAQEEWEHLSQRDRRSYQEDPAGVFCVTLRPVEWDESLGIFCEAIDGDVIIEAWSALG